MKENVETRGRQTKGETRQRGREKEEEEGWRYRHGGIEQYAHI